MQGLIEKAIGGACYFWLADYAQAIAHYQAAYTLLRKLGRNHWLVDPFRYDWPRSMPSSGIILLSVTISPRAGSFVTSCAITSC